MNYESAISSVLTTSFNKTVTLKELFDKRLEFTGLRHSNAANLLGIDRKSLDPILDGTAKQADLVKVIKIGEFLGLDVEATLAAFLRTKDKDGMAELEIARKAAYLTANFDLPRLKESGFLTSINDLAYIEKRICTYFEIPNIFAYDNIQSSILFSRTKNPYGNLMIDFWMKSSYGYFEKLQNGNEYNRDALKAIIPKIRPYTRNEKKGLLIVIRALYNVGVTVIFQKHLSKTQIRGATMLVNDKPCIVLTDLNKNYATIWFALLHELGHVLYDLDTIRNTSFHLTGEPDLFLIEDKANQFARNILFSEDKMAYINRFIHNEVLVSQYAQEVNVHPSIIYSFFQYDMDLEGKNYWRAFGKHFPRVDSLLKEINIGLWSDEEIQESVDKIKTIFSTSINPKLDERRD